MHSKTYCILDPQMSMIVYNVYDSEPAVNLSSILRFYSQFTILEIFRRLKTTANNQRMT